MEIGNVLRAGQGRAQGSNGVARDTSGDYSARWPIFALALLAFGSASAQEAYVIDGTHTVPMFEVRHQGMSLQRGFFTNTIGKVTLDRTAKTGSIDVEIGAGSLAAAIVSRVVNDVLKGVGYFNAEQFPTLRYVARQIAFDGDVPVRADGELTLLGVTKPVPLAISDFRCGEQYVTRRPMCAAQAIATIRRSDFGMTGGLPNVVGDEVRIVIPVEALRQ
jgi:polyisoprenoid-binding protein YceI